jgi:hypothetical protein
MANDIMTAKSADVPPVLSAAQARLAARLAATTARRDAARALLTPDDVAEQAMRDDIAKGEEEEREALAAKRALDLARRLDAAGDKIGNAALVRALSIKGFDDTFIVRRNGPAHAKWEKTMGDALTNSKIDQVESKKRYASQSVVDWNGRDLDDSTVTYEFDKFLDENPGVVTSIVGEAIELNGAVKEARKRSS